MSCRVIGILRYRSVCHYHNTKLYVLYVDDSCNQITSNDIKTNRYNLLDYSIDTLNKANACTSEVETVKDKNYTYLFNYYIIELKNICVFVSTSVYFYLYGYH